MNKVGITSPLLNAQDMQVGDVMRTVKGGYLVMRTSLNYVVYLHNGALAPTDAETKIIGEKLPERIILTMEVNNEVPNV